MSKNNSEWLDGDEKELQYHVNQYEQPKEYSKVIIKYLKDWNLITNSNCRILDLGCGTGANCYYFAKEYKNAIFDGVDLNSNYIKIALQKKLPNTNFTCDDILILESVDKFYNGLLSIQTLSWLKNYNLALKKMLELKPDWVLITSLFFDGPVDSEILITDYSRSVGDLNYRSSYYNIYSLFKLEEFVNSNDYYIDKKEPFEFPFDLPKPENSNMGTYTEKLLNKKRIQISGPLIMPWYTILLRKKQ